MYNIIQPPIYLGATLHMKIYSTIPVDNEPPQVWVDAIEP